MLQQGKEEKKADEKERSNHQCWPTTTAVSSTASSSGLLHHPLARAIQREDSVLLQYTLQYYNDPNIHIPQLPAGLLAFACYLGNPALTYILLQAGADHQRVISLLSSRITFQIDRQCIELLQVSSISDVTGTFLRSIVDPTV